MIEAISNYAITLVCASFLINLVEMILPSGNMRKYVIFVCGVIITILLIRPIITFSHEEIDVSEILSEQVEIQTEIEEKKYQDFYTNEVIKAYQQNLESGIRERIQQAGYLVSKIQIEYDAVSLEPKYLNLAIETKEKMVEPVRIEVSNRSTPQKETISSFELLKIKKMLLEEYGFERIDISG